MANFESGTINHSDTSPSFKFYLKPTLQGKVGDNLLVFTDENTKLTKRSGQFNLLGRFRVNESSYLLLVELWA